jgi:hypothetical protein
MALCRLFANGEERVRGATQRRDDHGRLPRKAAFDDLSGTLDCVRISD